MSTSNPLAHIDGYRDRDGLLQVGSQMQMRQVAKALGVRPDFHEPDERGVSARVIGTHLDNAMGSSSTNNVNEMNVVLTYVEDDEAPQDVAVVNLATLLAFAAGTHQG